MTATFPLVFFNFILFSIISYGFVMISMFFLHFQWFCMNGLFFQTFSNIAIKCQSVFVFFSWVHFRPLSMAALSRTCGWSRFYLKQPAVLAFRGPAHCIGHEKLDPGHENPERTRKAGGPRRPPPAPIPAPTPKNGSTLSIRTQALQKLIYDFCIWEQVFTIFVKP